MLARVVDVVEDIQSKLEAKLAALYSSTVRTDGIKLISLEELCQVCSPLRVLMSVSAMKHATLKTPSKSIQQLFEALSRWCPSSKGTVRSCSE